MDQATVPRFEENIERVEKLVSLYRSLSRAGQGRRPVNSSDVLRAAVVMLHAALEDFFRSVAREQLPSAQPDALEAVPLAGTRELHAKKFTLGDVAKFRGQSVDEVIEASVCEYLDRSSFNNPGDIKQLLNTLRVNADAVDAPWSAVAEMIDRRHWIVHQADRNPNQGRGHHRARSIGMGKVDEWTTAVRSLIDAVKTEL